jgi:hypothetical protein
MASRRNLGKSGPRFPALGAILRQTIGRCVNLSAKRTRQQIRDRILQSQKSRHGASTSASGQDRSANANGPGFPGPPLPFR